MEEEDNPRGKSKDRLLDLIQSENSGSRRRYRKTFEKTSWDPTGLEASVVVDFWTYTYTPAPSRAPAPPRVREYTHPHAHTPLPPVPPNGTQER